VNLSLVDGCLPAARMPAASLFLMLEENLSLVDGCLPAARMPAASLFLMLEENLSLVDGCYRSFFGCFVFYSQLCAH